VVVARGRGRWVVVAVGRGLVVVVVGLGLAVVVVGRSRVVAVGLGDLVVVVVAGGLVVVVTAWGLMLVVGSGLVVVVMRCGLAVVVVGFGFVVVVVGRVLVVVVTRCGLVVVVVGGGRVVVVVGGSVVDVVVVAAVVTVVAGAVVNVVIGAVVVVVGAVVVSQLMKTALGGHGFEVVVVVGAGGRAKQTGGHLRMSREVVVGRTWANAGSSWSAPPARTSVANMARARQTAVAAIAGRRRPLRFRSWRRDRREATRTSSMPSVRATRRRFPSFTGLTRVPSASLRPATSTTERL
jgi:hypothetical protein